MKPYYDDGKGIVIHHGDCREILPSLPKVDLVRYCDSLARENSEALSFIPRPRLFEYAEHGQILMELENGDPCGFLIFGNGWPTLRVYQACIQCDARRREHGFALVRRLIDVADKRRAASVSLWCANDLEANEFWRLCGFSFCGQREGGRRRGRLHNLWRLSITPTLLDCEIAVKRLSQDVLDFSK